LPPTRWRYLPLQKMEAYLMNEAIRAVTQEEQDDLLERQWRARMWISANVFANTANCQVRIKMRNRLQRKMESKVLQFNSSNLS